MESRRARAVTERDRLIQAIVANARVFQGGGSEVIRVELVDKLRAAAEDSLVRLFPRFKEADSKVWSSVIRRARDGAEHPFEPTGHTDATEKHPVCQQVIASIGAVNTGNEIRKQLRSSPFGWPQDAIDAALIALHRSQHVNVTLNGAPVVPGQLDQNKISKAEFRVEQATLSVGDRLVLRKLYQAAGMMCRSGEEGAKASEFLTKLQDLARSAGGNPPLPAISGTTDLEDIEKLVGNEQLVAIKDKAKDIEQRISQWTGSHDLAKERLPKWALANRLAQCAQGLPEAEPHREQLDAIRDERQLLDPSDPVTPQCKALADLLRKKVKGLQAEHEKAYEQAQDALKANDSWQQLDASEQQAILGEVGLVAPSPPDVSSDDKLAALLEARPLSAAQAEIDAVASRVSHAIQRAAKRLEPEVQTVTLERMTLRTETDVDAWLDRQKKRLLDALKKGPALID